MIKRPPSHFRLYLDTPRAVAWSFIVVFIFILGILSTQRHTLYNSNAFDLAIYDHALWRMARGDLLAFLKPAFTGAAHVDPIMILLVPFRWLFADVRWLLLLQTIALGLGGWGIYRITSRVWPQAQAGALFTAVYLLYLPVGYMAIFDFHPVALATPLLIFAFDAADTQHFRRAAILLLLALMCKEEIGFVAASLGIYWFLVKRWKWGLLWAVFGFLWAALSYFVILPGGLNLDAVGTHSYYSWLFQGDIQSRIDFFIRMNQFYWDYKVQWMTAMFAPLLLLPFLKPAIFLIAVPTILLHALSTLPLQLGVEHQYMAAVAPFTLIAAVHGGYRVWAWLQKSVSKRRQGLFLRVGAFAMVVISVSIYVAKGPHIHQPLQGGASLNGLEAAMLRIDPTDCLITASNIAPHYTKIEKLYLFNQAGVQCDIALADMGDDRYPQFETTGPQAACQLFEQQNYHPIFLQDQVVILQHAGVLHEGLISEMTMLCKPYSAKDKR